MKKIIFLSITTLLLTVTVQAQNQNGNHNGDNGNALPAAAPVDGGLGLLLIVGVAGYTAKKIVEDKKRKKVRSI